MYVMSTYMKFVCPYCLQTSHKVSQSIGLFGAQAPLGRFLHSGDSPVFGGAFNGFWIEVMRDSFCFVTCCTATAYGCSANGSPTLKKSLLRSSFFYFFVPGLFFGDFYLEESHLCEVAVVVELVLDLARVVDERKIALQLFCLRVK